MGRRVSIQLTTGFLNSLLFRPTIGKTSSKWAGGLGCAASADLDLGVAFEGVGRHRQIGRRRPVAHAPGGVVLAAMAGAEPAAPVAAHVGRLVAGRDAAEMRAGADRKSVG